MSTSEHAACPDGTTRTEFAQCFCGVRIRRNWVLRADDPEWSEFAPLLLRQFSHSPWVHDPLSDGGAGVSSDAALASAEKRARRAEGEVEELREQWATTHELMDRQLDEAVRQRDGAVRRAQMWMDDLAQMRKQCQHWESEAVRLENALAAAREATHG